MLNRIITSRQGQSPLALLLVAALALVCVWLAIRLAATLLGAGADSQAAPDTVIAPGLPLAPRESVAGWHLFGSTLPTQDAREQVATAPATDQDLKLVGVLAETDPATGVAFVAAADGVQAAYRVGAELPGGSRLRAVYPEHILLDRGGREESLRLLVEPAPSSAMPAGTSPLGVPALPAAAIAPGAPAISGNGNVDWAQVQQQMQVDPAELARQVRVLPVIENGSVVGMRVSGGASAPLIAKLGLQPDDIVTAVNGISVRDVGRAQQIMASVRDAERVNVTVRRNGREQTLNVELK